MQQQAASTILMLVHAWPCSLKCLKDLVASHCMLQWPNRTCARFLPSSWKCQPFRKKVDEEHPTMETNFRPRTDPG
jgi:hypothetical protein